MGKNKYWAMGLGLWAVLSIYMTISGTAMSYYSKWILGDELYTSPLYLAEQVPSIVVIFFIPWLLKKYTKRTLSLVGAAICIVGQLALVVAPESLTMAMVASVCRGIGQAPLSGGLMERIPRHHARASGPRGAGETLNYIKGSRSYHATATKE